MSQTSLQDLLKDIMSNHKESFDKAQDGVPTGDWDGPELPLNLEYRVRVFKAEVKPSNAGNLQIVLTYEVQEPVEYEGRKLQGYYSLAPTNEAASKNLASMLGAMRARMDGWGDDNDAFAAQFVDNTAVIALKRWGTENDRSGVRWINGDRGQGLRTNLEAQKPQAPKKDLRADVNIPKNEAADAPAAPPIVIPGPAQTPADKVVPPSSGVNLPPGLRP